MWNEEWGKSRSQKKRDSLALQKLGEELAVLSSSLLSELKLSNELVTAIEEWKKISSHEAKRRQMQYVGKCMREVENPEELAQQVADLQKGLRPREDLLERCESIRSALLAPEKKEQEKAEQVFLDEFASVDVVVLRRFVQQYFETSDPKVKTKSFRELFRLIRKVVSESSEAQ